ncbi:hypothetical protein DOTSEDRAFT_37756 [Dothistroma septosporum NZE10]|uniref:Uncharacterized protein n=1 Tax=Dothistroma septosporum (strain NZE10 / CBS 128990) TaxID=675120 RepID=N1PIA3_DOTSN|nr:hypothetical protein DOTSEDRAFT_37756 [Dothistroma septosporum NZE10]
MPPSPPQTPTSSSVYSRTVVDAPLAPRKSNGRTFPEFPRYGQPTTKYPRRPRVLNVRYLPGHYKQGCITITSEQWNKTRTKDLSLNVSTGVFSKGSGPSQDPPQKSTSEVRIDAVAAGLNDAHFAMPCIRNSLRHELTCGHTICTSEPEVCAKNCKGSHDPGQVKDCDTPFECMQCITNHVQEMQYGRLAMFTAELADRANEMGKSSDWVHDKIGFMEMAWRDEDLEEIRSLLEIGKGRFCQSLWIEPEIQDLVDTADKARMIPTTSSQEQYASPTWMHRSTPEPSNPRSRISIEDRVYSPRSSISAITTTDSRLPSLQRSVTKLFARREKKEAQPARPPSAAGTDSSSPDFIPPYADDEPEAEQVTMGFE